MAELEEMEIEYDCTLYYCVADSVDPSVEAVRARGTFTGVSAGSKFSEAVAAVKEAAGGSQVFRLRLSKNEQPAWARITRQVSDYVCKRGDRFYFKVLPPLAQQVAGGATCNAVPSGSTSWDIKSVVRALVEHYGEAAKKRSLDAMRKEFPFDPEPGNNFPIAGRDATYDVLLKGVGEMYGRFKSPSPSQDTYKSGPFFFAMVAFPGAGKTALGKRGWSFLMERWDAMDDNEKQTLLDGTLESFRPMVASSRSLNLVMYHEVANQSGRMVYGEKELAPRQVLGLRTLYMACHNEASGYEESYSKLDTCNDLQGLKNHITFEAVIEYMVEALRLDRDSRYMATFFFDEVNAVDCTASGQKARADDATWFQEMMSEYVDAHHNLAMTGSPIFPVFSIATTRYSAGDLMFTRSRKSTAILVPFPPLSTADAESVVLNYLQLVATRKNIEVPLQLTGLVKHMIRLSGGMPRYISLGLLALKEENFFQELGAIEAGGFMERWHGLLSVRSNFEKYLDTEKYEPGFKDVLLKALAMAVLGESVKRREEVVSGQELRWWELEWSGITALTSQRYTVTDDPGTGYGLVKLCPILIQPLLSSLGTGWPVRWPPLTSTDPAVKEIADALSVLLRVFLYQTVHSADSFPLKSAFPRGSFIPYHMLGARLRLSGCNHMFQLACSREQVNPETFRRLGHSAVKGPGNDAADWYVFCDGVTIAGESKLSKLVDNVTVRYILKCYQRLGKYYKLPHVPPQAQKLLDEVAVRAQSRAAARNFDLTDRLVEEVDTEAEPRRSSRNKNPPSWLGDYATQSSEVNAMLEEECRGWDAKVDDRRKAKRNKLERPFLQGTPLYVFCSTKPVPVETIGALTLLEDEHPWVAGLVVFHEREAVSTNDALSVLSVIRTLGLIDRSVVLSVW